MNHHLSEQNNKNLISMGELAIKYLVAVIAITTVHLPG